MLHSIARTSCVNAVGTASVHLCPKLNTFSLAETSGLQQGHCTEFATSVELGQFIRQGASHSGAPIDERKDRQALKRAGNHHTECTDTPLSVVTVGSPNHRLLDNASVSQSQEWASVQSSYGHMCQCSHLPIVGLYWHCFNAIPPTFHLPGDVLFMHSRTETENGQMLGNEMLCSLHVTTFVILLLFILWINSSQPFASCFPPLILSKHASPSTVKHVLLLFLKKRTRSDNKVRELATVC
jgi:hypothetical protein